MNIISVVLQWIYVRRPEDRHGAADRRISTVSRCDEGKNNWSYINKYTSLYAVYT
jgi:hypothetical protein